MLCYKKSPLLIFDKRLCTYSFPIVLPIIVLSKFNCHFTTCTYKVILPKRTSFVFRYRHCKLPKKLRQNKV